MPASIMVLAPVFLYFHEVHDLPNCENDFQIDRFTTALAIEPGSIDHLTQMISHVVAPAFLLGAVAGFISILTTRMNGILERIRSINDIPHEGHAKSQLKSDLSRLRRRTALLQRSILFAIGSGIVATVLIIAAFGAALVSITHAWSTAIFFIISLGLLTASLVTFAMEVLIGLNDYDHY